MINDTLWGSVVSLWDSVIQKQFSTETQSAQNFTEIKLFKKNVSFAPKKTKCGWVGLDGRCVCVCYTNFRENQGFLRENINKIHNTFFHYSSFKR